MKISERNKVLYYIFLAITMITLCCSCVSTKKFNAYKSENETQHEKLVQLINKIQVK